ncbi:MAG TPA: RNA methyltransferase [Candidatus Acidoferrales bacterium]|nr:RNA methyltransferase [Candidatus Acidoferrales bacterium]
MSGERKALADVSVAIPASLVSDTPHLREKTAKLGVLARACSIFGVSEIVIYLDDERRGLTTDLDLCVEILSFLQTPPYLRKKLYGIRPSLKYAGILPPLQSPHHNVPRSISESKIGDLRVGIVSSHCSGRIQVEAGLERPLSCRGDLPVGSVLTLRVTEVGGVLAGEVVDESKIHIYWGYRVRRAKSKLSRLLEEERYELKIGTSRYGIQVQDVWSEIGKSLRDVKSVLVVFGSPKLGLMEILGQDGLSPESKFDFFINTIPEQNVATVRTEEAVLVTLSLLNMMNMRLG